MAERSLLSVAVMHMKSEPLAVGMQGGKDAGTGGGEQWKTREKGESQHSALSLRELRSLSLRLGLSEEAWGKVMSHGPDEMEVVRQISLPSELMLC